MEPGRAGADLLEMRCVYESAEFRQGIIPYAGTMHVRSEGVVFRTLSSTLDNTTFPSLPTEKTTSNGIQENQNQNVHPQFIRPPGKVPSSNLREIRKDNGHRSRERSDISATEAGWERLPVTAD